MTESGEIVPMAPTSSCDLMGASTTYKSSDVVGVAEALERAASRLGVKVDD